jgi:hypothetical protein
VKSLCLQTFNVHTPTPAAESAGFALAHYPAGYNRTACFYADEDYCCYLYHLAEQARRFDCQVHAYVLMTNLCTC